MICTHPGCVTITGMESRVGARVFGPDDLVLWSVRPPLAAARVTDGTADVDIWEIPADPGAVARAHAESRGQVEVAVAVEVTAAAAGSVAADCADAGADVLIGDHPAVLAAAARCGTALLCTDPDAARAAGVRPDRVIVDAGPEPSAATVTRLVRSGCPVLVRLSPGAGPDTLAAASVYAWLGVRVFRAGSPDDVRSLRQVLDMVSSIKGHRPPALGRRGLA